MLSVPASVEDLHAVIEEVGAGDPVVSVADLELTVQSLLDQALVEHASI